MRKHYEYLISRVNVAYNNFNLDGYIIVAIYHPLKPLHKIVTFMEDIVSEIIILPRNFPNYELTIVGD